MEYIINGTVKYNSADGTLFGPDSSVDMITLTRVTSELLLLLIQNNGVPLSRDSILSELWEKRGLSASSNNLNNYVSMLRKALVQCGCPDLITTIPKHGFLFRAEIEVVGEELRLPSELQARAGVTDHDAAELSVSPQMSGNKTKPLSGLAHWKLKVAIILFSVLALFYSPEIYNYFRLKTIKTELFSLDRCHFFLADDITRRMDRDTTINTIKMIVSNEGLKCDSEVEAYYFADKKLDSLGHVVMTDMLSYCPYDSKSPCENYYLSKHENKDENEN